MHDALSWLLCSASVTEHWVLTYRAEKMTKFTKPKIQTESNHAPMPIRTTDLFITSETLYQLSYRGLKPMARNSVQVHDSIYSFSQFHRLYVSSVIVSTSDLLHTIPFPGTALRFTTQIHHQESPSHCCLTCHKMKMLSTPWSVQKD